INGAPTSGWYTVQVAGFAGTPQNGVFTLHYGRYFMNNPNCATPTLPLADTGAGTAAKQAGPDSAAQPPAPTDPAGARRRGRHGGACVGRAAGSVAGSRGLGRIRWCRTAALARRCFSRVPQPSG